MTPTLPQITALARAGAVGRGWALFVAGVPTTVVSQWKVRADSTAALMVEFHRQWQLQRTGTWAKAEALRQAIGCRPAPSDHGAAPVAVRN